MVETTTTSGITSEVDALNKELGLDTPAAEEKQTPKDDAIPVTPLPDKFQLEIPLKNGLPQLPASMIRVEVGVHQNPKSKPGGFQSIGTVVVYFGLPLPLANGKTRFHPHAWIDFKLDIKAGPDKTVQEVKILSPFWSTGKEKDEDEGEPDFYPAAMFTHKDRICRTVLAIMKAKKLRPIMDIWKERRGERADYKYRCAPAEAEALAELVE